MRKRILAIMLVLPLLVAFVALGFTKLISIAVAQTPEFIYIEYEENEAFEFNDFHETMVLKGYIYPEAATGELVWTSSDESIAKINGNTLTFIDEGLVTITAQVLNTTITKSFTVALVLSGDVPKFFKVNYAYPSEKGTNVIGLYDYADSLKSEEKVAHTEVINFSIVPSKSPQDVIVTGLSAGEYTIKDKQLLLHPSKAGKYDITIQSAVESSVVYTMSCEVTDSVNVYTYEDLVRATDLSSGYSVALRSNLESASNSKVRANSKPMSYASGKAHEYVEFESTYDTKYLRANGKNTKLKAAIVFKNDVYGNGHTLNLHDFAYPSETDPSTNVAIPAPGDVFAGEPLEFVTAGGLTVFGQGNAGFMIQGNGITVDNVVLKNCNNVSDLSNLDYVGTVVEVVGDGITIKNSTVMNGRTVVRSFSNENLLIENCILAYAREFIFKQGSNNFVYAPHDEPDSPAFDSLDIDKIEQINNWVREKLFVYDNLPEAAKKGDSTATIKDTDFYISGIFCIGMDTHFAGLLLYDGSIVDPTIKGLAATSYKSTLNLEGDVKFYDWKIVKNMDSSTLIKGTHDGFEFNIYNLMKNYSSNYGGEIIRNIDGVDYVHGGIAFFGGGNNLSEVYFNGARVKCDSGYKGLNDDKFVSLSVALSDNNVFDIGNTLLTMAAGEGSFSFCIYRNTYDEIGINDSPF